MAARVSARKVGRARPRRRAVGAARTARPVRSAAERAVERVLSSDEAFALLMRRLEAAGWHIERDVPGLHRRVEAAGGREVAGREAALTPPARAR